MPGSSVPDPAAIVDDLLRERRELLAILDALEPDSMTAPGLLGDWSAREVIAHLGYWAGHATELIHAVEEGRIDEVGVDEPPVDEVNATVARVAASTPLATVVRREQASVDALVARLQAVDPARLEDRLPDGTTLEAGIREDGPDHYREHADELTRSLREAPRA